MCWALSWAEEEVTRTRRKDGFLGTECTNSCPVRPEVPAEEGTRWKERLPSRATWVPIAGGDMSHGMQMIILPMKSHQGLQGSWHNKYAQEWLPPSQLCLLPQPSAVASSGPRGPAVGSGTEPDGPRSKSGPITSRRARIAHVLPIKKTNYTFSPAQQKPLRA